MGKRSTFVNPTGWKRLKRKRNAWVSSQTEFTDVIHIEYSKTKMGMGRVEGISLDKEMNDGRWKYPTAILGVL